MKHVNDTMPDPRRLDTDTDPAAPSVDDGPTDPGPAPEAAGVDDVLAGFRGRRAPVAKRRTPESAGLAGAAYDTTASPVKAHETPARSAAVVVNVTEELPAVVAARPTTPMNGAPAMVVEERLARSNTTVKKAPRRASSSAVTIVLAVALVAGVIVAGVLALRSGDKASAPPAPSVTPSASSATKEPTSAAASVAAPLRTLAPPATTSAPPSPSPSPSFSPSPTTTSRPRSTRPDSAPALSSRPRSDIKVDYE